MVSFANLQVSHILLNNMIHFNPRSQLFALIAFHLLLELLALLNDPNIVHLSTVQHIKHLHILLGLPLLHLLHRVAKSLV